MSAASVRAFLAEHAPDIAVIDHGQSTATVAEAAATLGVVPARIAKTLSLRTPDGVVLVVARGDARLDNAKMKAALGGRAKMLGGEEVLALTGHPVGGVCPFGLATPLPVLCDVSLKAFATVFPAAGSGTTSVEIAPERLAQIVGARWVDVCGPPPAA
ncbi:MAG: cys-tRNA(pro)/cys-tRNA(cys) deacylase [Mesorhizobium amorphae]|nr:MAG: cys-tRNA(pro)/cys-tRNA(cys) deacylase [Mesorhizobium amorphae]